MIASIVTSAALTAAIGICVALYLLPAAIGWARHVPHLGSLAVIDALLGWTLLGWVIALAMALRTVTPASPVIQVVQNLPPAPPEPSGLPPADWSGPPDLLPPRQAPPPLDLPPRPPGTAGPAGGIAGP